MQQQIELKFYWRRPEIKEAVIAVSYAVAAGYNTKSKILSVLPQFASYRIALAIDALITYDMAEINLGLLTINPDMYVLFELLKGKFVFPLNMEDAKNRNVRRFLLNKLGCKNPDGMEAFLSIDAVEG